MDGRIVHLNVADGRSNVAFLFRSERESEPSRETLHCIGTNLQSLDYVSTVCIVSFLRRRCGKQCEIPITKDYLNATNLDFRFKSSFMRASSC